MPRLLSALNEWLERRARMREERQFHLERASADLRALGLTAREAKRMARIRFGSRRNSQTGLRELGGDLRGLANLFRAHRVAASLWFQPIVLLAAGALIFAVSPSPREIAEGLLGRTFGAEVREAVALSVYGAGPASPGITLTELASLQSMATVTRVESFGPHQVLAQPVKGITLAAITSEAVARTGNRGFYAAWILRQPGIDTTAAKVVWLLAALYGAFFLYSRLHRRVTLPWLLYAGSMAFLHSAVSIVAWALATQLWSRAPWSGKSWQTPTTAGLSFSLLAVICLLVAAVQCRYWWLDLRRRCPVCLDRLLLSQTQGDASRIVLGAAITESVCAQGHGILIESRWSRDFRRGHSLFSGPTCV
jgi:hypothetical protein